jgi:hypothetical protein
MVLTKATKILDCLGGTGNLLLLMIRRDLLNNNLLGLRFRFFEMVSNRKILMVAFQVIAGYY